MILDRYFKFNDKFATNSVSCLTINNPNCLHLHGVLSANIIFLNKY